MPQRPRYRLEFALYLAVILFCFCSLPLLANSTPKPAAKRKVPDYVTIPVLAHKADVTLDEDSLLDSFSLSGSPYQGLLARVLAPQAGCLLKEQALIMHFGSWYAFGVKGPFMLVSSNWYVYHATSKSTKLAAAYIKAAPAGKGVQQIGNCELKQAGLKADETARLYGDKSAILLTVDIIKPSAGPSSPCWPGCPATTSNISGRSMHANPARPRVPWPSRVRSSGC